MRVESNDAMVVQAEGYITQPFPGGTGTATTGTGTCGGTIGG